MSILTEMPIQNQYNVACIEPGTGAILGVLNLPRGNRQMCGLYEFTALAKGGICECCGHTIATDKTKVFELVIGYSHNSTYSTGTYSTYLTRVEFENLRDNFIDMEVV